MTETDQSNSDAREKHGDVVGAAVEASESFEWLGRAGWVAKGIVYMAVGVLFVRIAFGAPTSEANQAGAIESIARTPFGSVTLVVLATGLLLYAAWRLFTVILPGDWTGKALLERIGYAVSAGIYFSLLITIAGFLFDSGGDAGEREDRMVESLVNSVLSVTAGRTMIIIVGLIVVVIGLVFTRKGWTRSFREQLSGYDGLEGTVMERLGVVGWTARGASMGLVGFFLIRAAWTFDPDDAAGLDDSIRQTSEHPLGAVLAGVVGLGFIAYGIFAALSARFRNLEGPSND